MLVRILVHLRAKPAAYRVIDTHAGAGVYDLAILLPELAAALSGACNGGHRLDMLAGEL